MSISRLRVLNILIFSARTEEACRTGRCLEFFDRDNNTLVLRPDMTPAVARCVAKYFMDDHMPLRLCYLERTFKNNSSYQGRLKERAETGAELIGDDSEDADAEMIAMVIDSLRQAGLPGSSRWSWVRWRFTEAF
ncbi:MAG: ATP phosphoribosyltransferase regulatory subunit [Enterocloster clostridioformis]